MKRSLGTKVVVILFFLVFTMDSLGIVLGEMTMRYIFKPLISPLLIVIYILTVSKVNPFYVAALVFAFIADVLLLNSSDEFFIYALGSFLLMHLSYLLILTKDIYKYKTKRLSVISIPFIVVLAMVIFFASNGINEFLWPIIVYGLVVCFFSALSFYHYLEKKSDTSLLLFLGSFMFIVSNSMSAIEKFRLQNRDLAVGIMFIYVIAQFLIYMHMARKTKDV